MSRNRIEANTEIFKRLDEFCRVRDLLLETHGRPRWIMTKSRDRHVLDKLVFKEIINLGGGRLLGYGQIDKNQHLIASGFEFADSPAGFEECVVGSGHLTAILSDFPIPVAASEYEIKDIIDLHDKTTPGYEGHDHIQVAKLFSSVRIFVSENHLQSPWNSFFKLCLNERSTGFNPINRELRETLFVLADLNPNLLPYRVMCRSIFDVDPSSFFLALYRCLESLYSFASARELRHRLKIEQNWQEIAATVENVTGWYPREESSLESLLRLASPADLQRLVTAAGEHLAEGQSPSEKAAKVIYSLRNAAVHFRPAHQSSQLEKHRWPDICKHLVGLILDVYVEANRKL